MDLRKIKNYVTLSLTRVMESHENENELVHLTAVRFYDDRPVEYVDCYVENSKKKYDENLNKKAFPLNLVLANLQAWVENEVIILHEGGRKDIEWLSEELNKRLDLRFANSYINIEDIAASVMRLPKTSLKNIAKHFGVFRYNSNSNLTRDAHNCFLIHEIWKAYKEDYKLYN